VENRERVPAEGPWKQEDQLPMLHTANAFLVRGSGVEAGLLQACLKVELPQDSRHPGRSINRSSAEIVAGTSKEAIADLDRNPQVGLVATG